MKSRNDYVFFWDGTYSQWAKSNFKEDGKTFNTAEQYMMYHKAKLFGDTAIAAKILQTPDPKTQKSLGRQISGYDQKTWDDNKRQIVFRGNLLKFTQNPTMLLELLGSGNRTIVEASPEDKIWGIGMHENDEGIEDPRNWKGQNLLGKAIMDVRHIIREGGIGIK